MRKKKKQSKPLREEIIKKLAKTSKDYLYVQLKNSLTLENEGKAKSISQILGY